MNRSGFIKFITRAAVVVLLLLFVFYGFLKYRQYDSYQGMIHKNADLIIKINSDQLIQKIALNSISNPSFYFSPSEEDSTSAEDVDVISKGFTLPANLFIYSLKGDIKTYYTSLKVNDSSALKTYIQSKLDVSNFKVLRKYSYASSEDNKIQIAYNDQRLALAYTFNGQDIKKTLEQILSQNEAVATDSETISTLREASGDVVILQRDNLADIDFDNGKIVLSGIWNPDVGIEFPTTAPVALPDTGTSLHLGFSGNVPAQFLKSYNINSITIPLDSLARDYGGYFDLKVTGNTIQHDTIITYDYNDDFEKVEVKTVNKTKVPGVRVLIKGKANHMLDLLRKNRIAINNKLNRTILPLLDLSIIENDSSELFLTNLDSVPAPRYTNSPDFFMLHTNFQRLGLQNSLFVQHKYLKNLNTLNIQASRVGKAVSIKGQLLLNNEDINALIQLIRN
ncbi:hypothetical protein JMN32_20140 [Fulvivirga sp. 29W222]|uniref:Uncharacterized protein n=1 Tax=Fulvivirga marina TaxID=2494733 RepID=A0A937G188_9BACT|nr:hypothetical protein [Fulvivirga marina]MBL6448633.1 hypothetical protein [Fulvivirga marina]